MKQTERLLQIVNLLRNRRTVLTAEYLADYFSVSPRTIYRDIQKLESSGIPIEGEAGVGYRLHRSVNLPPLMFSSSEVEALMLGVKMVSAWSDAELSSAAKNALNKIIGALPSELKTLGEYLPFEVPVFPDYYTENNPSQQLRKAIRERIIIQVAYQDAQQQLTERTLYPLGLFFWGNVWTLAAWCTLRNNYRAFRLDRITALTMTDEVFTQNENCCLQDYIAQQKSADGKGRDCGL